MAKQPIDVGAKITADVTGFQKAAGQVKGSTQAMKKDIKETAGVFDELGGAIGGLGGEISSSISGIVTAASGIGAIVVVIGALAKAWETSQENIDLYLKSADKLKEGSGGFIRDAQASLEDTKKRAKGQVTLGYELQRVNTAKAYGVQSILYSDSEKEYFKTLIAEGIQMQKNGKVLLDSVRGIHDKTEWQKKYSALLKEEEQLNDAGLVNAIKWEAVEADFAKQKEIIANKDSTAADKAAAVVQAEKDANQLVKEKGTFLDAQLKNVNAIAEMTATEEVVEGKVAGLMKEKNTLLKEYSVDMLKVDRLENKAIKAGKEKVISLKELLNLEKEKNTKGSEGFNIEKAPTKQIEYNAPPWMMPDGADKLREYIGLTKEQTDAIKKENKEFEEQSMILDGILGVVDNVTTSLGEMISGTKGAFNDLVSSMLGGLQRIIDGLLAEAIAAAIAKEAHKGLLGLITGAIAVAGVIALWQKVPAFADGTNFAPGGPSWVGERGPELVNLPRGSQVIPNRSIGMGGGTVNIRFVNGSLEGYMNWQQRKENSFR